MAARYQYDEGGLYFYYFMASVTGLVVAPWTYYTLTGGKEVPKEKKSEHWECNCEACEKKRVVLEKAETAKPRISWTHIGLIVAWLLFALFAFKAATTKPTETKAWDPFEILGISEGAEASAVRKAFRKLSLIYHPDKVEADKKEEAETKYVELSKAYKALTDEESRKNWEEFGHPDGKQSISVGIALPAWLVEAGSKHKVLALYTLIFGIILPLVISKWWTQSRTVTKDQILTGTMDRFAIEMRPGMKWTELLVLVSAALEFKVDTTRAPDGTVKPGMSSPDKAGMQKLFTAVNDAVDERLGEKLERPKRLMADEHGWKAYLLLLSHVVRADLDDPVLEADRRFAVSKAAHLLTGMMHVAISRWSLIMVHAVIDLGQILVQACHSFKMGPLWQLPHVDNEIMKHIKTKKRNVLTVANVVDMPENERRDLFRDLSDEQYEQLVEVAKRMPRIMVEKLEPRVIGEDQIETNAFITVFLKLKLKIPAKESGEPNKEEKKKDEEEKDEFADQEEDEEKPWWEIRAVSGEAVHAPYWPAEKYSGWWIVLGIPHTGSVVARPLKVSDLEDEKIVKLQFYGPREPGTMVMSIDIRSDSYIGCDMSVKFQFPVKPASQRAPEEDEDDISEPDEESFAGQLAMAKELQGGGKQAIKKKRKGKVGAAAAGGRAAALAKAGKAPAPAAKKAASPPQKAKKAETDSESDLSSDSSDSDSDSDIESSDEE